MKASSIGMILIASCASGAWAQVYKCPDASGKTVIQQLPCAGGKMLQDKPSTGATVPPASEWRDFPFTVEPVTSEQASASAKQDLPRMLGTLKDPDSAKVAGVRVMRFSGVGKTFTATCGTVNAKNSYGGYTGAKPFWVYSGIATQTLDHHMPDAPGHKAGKWQVACLSKGTEVPQQ